MGLAENSPHFLQAHSQYESLSKEAAQAKNELLQEKTGEKGLNFSPDACTRLKYQDTKKGIEAIQKEEILKLWARAKGAKGSNVAAFIEYVNSHLSYSLKVTQNKLFAWQRVYEAEGIEGLVDGRASRKQSQIEAYGVSSQPVEKIKNVLKF